MKVNLFSREQLLIVSLICFAVLLYLFLIFSRKADIIRRDIGRKADILALEQSFKKVKSNKSGTSELDCSDIGKYFQNIPSDPIGSPEHSEYKIYCNKNYYCICALLENNGAGNAVDGNCMINRGDGINWFCVESNDNLLTVAI